MKKYIKNFIFKILYFPVLNSIYRKIYRKHIYKKLNNFKISDLVVSIEPSNICNAKCRMCPYPSMERKKEIMPMELFRKIVDDCINDGIIVFNLNFYNEPFLDQFIFERIKYIKSKGGRVSLFSNASVMDREKADKALKSGLDRIDFSIDGATKKTYESIRQGLSFETVVGNVLYLISRKKILNFLKPKIRVVFVRQELNEAELKDFKTFWQDKADSVIVSFDDNRNKTSTFFKNNKIIKQTAFPCRKLWSEIIVMSSGEVALCCVDAKGGLVLGDFKKQTLKDVWNGEQFKRVRSIHLDFNADRISICRTCVHPYRMNLKSWW